MDFIREHKDVPFFMNLWIRETHTPHWLHNETLELPWVLGSRLRLSMTSRWR
jgi:N-acetylgalactosamine-6-sulfatase